MEQIKQHIEAIQKWQEENKDKRAVIILTCEIADETEKSFNQKNMFALSGRGDVLIHLLRDALKSHDGQLRTLISKAAFSNVIESITKKAEEK